MASAERDEFVARLKETRDELMRTVAGLNLTEEAAATPPAEGEWSVKQQLAHLAEVDRLWAGWGAQVRDGATEVGPTRRHASGQITFGQDTANSRPLAELLAELAAARHEALEIIAATGDEDLPKKGRMAGGEEMSVLQYFRALYRHDRMHIEQILGKPTTFQIRGQRERTS